MTYSSQFLQPGIFKLESYILKTLPQNGATNFYHRYKLNVAFDGSLNPEAGVQFKDGSVVNEELSLDLALGRQDERFCEPA